MRNIVYIGQPGCNACLALLNEVIEPLHGLYPDNVSIHFKWDGAIERVNRRKTITRVPLIVVEHDGREDFRYSGRLALDELKAIVECECETVALSDVLEGDFR